MYSLNSNHCKLEYNLATWSKFNIHVMYENRELDCVAKVTVRYYTNQVKVWETCTTFDIIVRAQLS